MKIFKFDYLAFLPNQSLNRENGNLAYHRNIHYYSYLYEDISGNLIIESRANLLKYDKIDKSYMYANLFSTTIQHISDATEPMFRYIKHVGYVSSTVYRDRTILEADEIITY